MPYADWVDFLEIVAIERVEKRYSELEDVALTGWQFYCTQIEKPMDFDKYKRALGIRRPQEQPEQRTKSKAAEQQKVRDVINSLGLGILKNGD